MPVDKYFENLYKDRSKGIKALMEKYIAKGCTVRKAQETTYRKLFGWK